MEITSGRIEQRPVSTRAKLPAALLVPCEAGGMAQHVCGVSVLSRLILSLDRAAAAVYVAAPPSFPRDVLDAARADAESRPTRPIVHWSQPITSIPVECGLLVALRPSLLDHRVCRGVEELPEREDRIIAIRRPGERQATLWYVGARRAPDLLRAITGREDTDAAVVAFFESQSVTEYDPGNDLCDPVAANSDRGPLEERLFGLGRKQSDTWIARVFDRRVSLWFTRRLVRLPITPNHITIGATGIGLLGCLLLACGPYWPQLLGGLLLTLAIIVDGCDGEVARIKYMESDFGRKLDFFLDNLVNILAIFAVGAGYYWQGGPGFYLWASAVNAGAAAGSVFPVYWLFFRENKEAVRLGEPATPRPPRNGLMAFVEDISGRDFAYLIFALALIGKAYWFTIFALFGLTAFFFVVVALSFGRGSRQAS